MNPFNIYITGVGGQGIGLLSEALIRAIDHAGHKAKGVDTHGLAQRGGIVVSQIRMGDDVATPLIRRNDADLVVSLEINEALRGMLTAGKRGSTLAYYKASWQPLAVRLGTAVVITPKDIEREAEKMKIKIFSVHDDTLPTVQMQNVALMGLISKNELIPYVEAAHYHNALADLLPEKLLKDNIAVFDRHSL